MKNQLKYFFSIVFLSSIFLSAKAQNYDVKGRVVDNKTNEPLSGVVVTVGNSYLWDVTDEKGEFYIDAIQKGEYVLKANYLGYVTFVTKVHSASNLSISLQESSLALEEVVVTAQKGEAALNTTISLNRNTLDHLQMSDMSNVASLLPGGKTINPDLTKENAFSLRSGGLSDPNAAFGTAVEVDGVRLGGNSSLSGLAGAGTRSVDVDNIESVEVITGVPSAEYGDLNSGMVKINTKKGRTPVNINFAINPRTYSASVSKGIDMQKDRGILNLSASWTKATAKLVSPYESYIRRNISVAYSNFFKRKLRFEVGVNGNIGGMNSEDDPDAFSGEYQKVSDNVLRAHTELTWLVNKPGITSLNFKANLNYNDKKDHLHSFETNSSELPSIGSLEQGYFLAQRLPKTYFADRIIDSKELNYSASLKYSWLKNWDGVRSHLKAGVQWRASGNVGAGEYYLDPALAESGYRPRPYTDYPFMHNFSLYAEEKLAFDVGETKAELTAGLRLENLYIKGSDYDRTTTFSPRFNFKWELLDGLAVRGGWGITEKMPSFFILFPRQEYRDILSSAFSHGDGASYIYYTEPFELKYNPELRWQKNQNAELGIDAKFLGTNISLVGFYNLTRDPYEFLKCYTPFSYNLYDVPGGLEIPNNPQIKVDPVNGQVAVNDGSNWVNFDKTLTDNTFMQYNYQSNGADIHRAGVELMVDFPEIRPIRTSFRLDAAYIYTSFVDDTESAFYRNGWSHTDGGDRSYQFVGIYANGGNLNSVVNGKITHNLDANLTATTHIPQARIIISCRLEMSLLRLSRNVSSYNGEDYAYTVSENGKTPTDGNIYDGNSYTAVRPIKYMDVDGNIYPFTDEQASDAAFSNLIIKSGNIYTFAQDGYGAYLSANLSVTKEIGKHVSLSFFANNFTNSRMAVKSFATGVSAIFTPTFYYGLTCRLKF